MNRRENIESGMVNFPMHLPSSREGGMFVRLFVMDKDPGIGECCGTEDQYMFEECFIGSDITIAAQREANKKIDKLWAYSALDPWNAEVKLRQEAKKEVSFIDYAGRESSHPLVANILMGSTGWSNSDFVCTYDDLTPDGKVVYNTMKLVYPGHKIALMTFLDT